MFVLSHLFEMMVFFFHQGVVSDSLLELWNFCLCVCFVSLSHLFEMAISFSPGLVSASLLGVVDILLYNVVYFVVRLLYVCFVYLSHLFEMAVFAFHLLVVFDSLLGVSVAHQVSVLLGECLILFFHCFQLLNTVEEKKKQA